MMEITVFIIYLKDVYKRQQYLNADTDFQFYQKTYSEVFTDVKDGRCDLGILMTLNLYTEEACSLFAQNDMEYHALGLSLIHI